MLCTYRRNSMGITCSTLYRTISSAQSWTAWDTLKQHIKTFILQLHTYLAYICAVETNFGGASAQEGNRAGLWAEQTVTCRDLNFPCRASLSRYLWPLPKDAARDSARAWIKVPASVHGFRVSQSIHSLLVFNSFRAAALQNRIDVDVPDEFVKSLC